MICRRPALSYEIWAVPPLNPILAFSNPSGSLAGARAYPSLLDMGSNSVQSLLSEHVALPSSGGGGPGRAFPEANGEAAALSPEVGVVVVDCSKAAPDEKSLEQPSIVMSTASATVTTCPP